MRYHCGSRVLPPLAWKAFWPTLSLSPWFSGSPQKEAKFFINFAQHAKLAQVGALSIGWCHLGNPGWRVRAKEKRARRRNAGPVPGTIRAHLKTSDSRFRGLGAESCASVERRNSGALSSSMDGAERRASGPKAAVRGFEMCSREAIHLAPVDSHLSCFRGCVALRSLAPANSLIPPSHKNTRNETLGPLSGSLL